MRRNIDKLITEYKKKHIKHPGAGLYAADVNSIVDKANGDLYRALLLCYEVGYSIGHRHGKRESGA